MSELWRLTATEMVELLRGGEVSAEEIAVDTLERLDAVNPAINAVVQEMPEHALESAREVDRKIARGVDPGPLAGVPVTTKVNVDQAGFATTNGLRIQCGLMAREDNPVVANLRKAGAVFVGRTNTPAFSLRWFTRNSLHGHTRNPRDPALTPGGSSGGAAAAVTAGIGAIAQGTDIGGSVRYPAYACGIHGLRPSLGRVPAANFTAPDRQIGAQLMAVSGPLARSIDDLRLALAAMAARDIRDPWWAPAPLESDAVERRAALCIAPDDLAVAPAVENALGDAARRLEDAGWNVEEVDCPSFTEAVRLQLGLWLTEFRRAGAKMIVEEDDPDAAFVYRQLDAMAPKYDLNGLLDILQQRVGLIRRWQQFLETYPVLICPVSGELPFPDQLDVESPESFQRVFDAQLVQLGLPVLGLPGLTVSTGMEGGLPVGVQLVAGRFEEELLLQAGEDIEAGGVPPTPIDPVSM
jgi:amidase